MYVQGTVTDTTHVRGGVLKTTRRSMSARGHGGASGPGGMSLSGDGAKRYWVGPRRVKRNDKRL